MVLLHDPTVSRFHADVRAEAGAHVLYSTGATGTRVNGKRVNHPLVLDEGDAIEIAGSEFVFTRGALPAGFTAHEWRADAADPELSRRTTQGFDVSEVADRIERTGRGSRIAVVTLVIIGALIVGAFLLLR
jgi:pSer/pThr/pTyr-binding forkhead associated (FHA) protein